LTTDLYAWVSDSPSPNAVGIALDFSVRGAMYRPYLYGYSYYMKHGTMPFGELSHRQQGIHEDLPLSLGSSKSKLLAGLSPSIYEKAPGK